MCLDRKSRPRSRSRHIRNETVGLAEEGAQFIKKKVTKLLRIRPCVRTRAASFRCTNTFGFLAPSRGRDCICIVTREGIYGELMAFWECTGN